jgi:hypothetical protein
VPLDIFTPRGYNVRDMSKSPVPQQTQQQRDAELAKTADEISILLQFRKDLPHPPSPTPFVDLSHFVPPDLPPPPPPSTDPPILITSPPPNLPEPSTTNTESKDRRKEERLKTLREHQLKRSTLRKSTQHQLTENQ